MPEEGVQLAPKAHLLSDDEIIRLAEMFIKQGVTKIRLTGGEPTVRKGVVELVGKCCLTPASDASNSIRSPRQIERIAPIWLALHWNDDQWDRTLQDAPSSGGKRVDSLEPQVRIIHTSYHRTQINRETSLDTLDPFKFEIMTRRRGHDAVLRALNVALSSNLQSVKLNVVVIKDLNDSEAPDFVQMTKEKDISVRFIEFMPFTGPCTYHTRLKFL